MERNWGRKLLLATRNPGKIREYHLLLTNLPFQMTSLDEAGVVQGVAEDGETFEENARTKAETYCSLSGLLTLADDSGLEVDALEGAPGVQSARYGGPGLSDEERVELLLHNLQEVPWERRAARFRCVIAVASPSQETWTVAGTVEGVVQYEPRGKNGFGYDPVFFLPELGVTMAELPLERKNTLSHRGKAAGKAAEQLRKM